MRTLIGLGLALAVALAGSPADAAPAERGSVEHSAGKPRNARITILARDIHRLPVIAYRGRTDDAPGTRIQNRGIAASRRRRTARTAGPAPAASATTR